MLKCTNFFSLAGQGWGETSYLDTTNFSLAGSALARAGQFRLGMMVSTAALVGARIADVNDRGNVVSSGNVEVAGTATGTKDITVNAALFRAFGASNTRRQLWCTAVPDECLINGKFAPTSAMALAVNAWINDAIASGWSIYAPDRATYPLTDIASVSNTGVLTTFAPQTWADNNVLKFYRAHFDNGLSIRKSYRILKLTTTTFQLTDWPAGRTVGNARVRKQVFIAYPYLRIRNVSAGTRKRGRVFGQRAGAVRRAK